MTTFPTNSDYAEALQHTDVCFHDRELKSGRVELTPLGMPRVISGNFAAVFSVTSCSGKRYAVKCFTKQVQGQHTRYEDVHDILAGLKLPWQVGFDYIKQGVLVNGQWYAIVRMEWVKNSKTLIPWLQQNVDSPDRVLHVARQFADCIDDMHRVGVAHGDLQHGNLLIDSNDRLRVIDYDGMFVPSIKNLGSNELGLANYQHPCRAANDFAPYLDRFSAWLIYGSLLSLAAYPAMWATFRNDGDEKLLLGKEDFLPPLDAIQRMGSLGSPHAEFATVLTEALASSTTLASIPEFDRSRIPLPIGAASRIGTPITAPEGKAWWRELGTATLHADSTSTPDTAANATPLGAGWLRSHAAPLPPVELMGPHRASKALALVLTAIVILGAVGLAAASQLLLGGTLLLAWLVALPITVWMLWNRSDAAIGRAAARREAKLADRDVARKQKEVEAARTARASLDRDERRAIQALENQRAKLRRSSVTEHERQSKDLRQRLTTLQNGLNSLDAAKAAEGQQQLKAMQEQHIQAYLTARRVEPGVIHGIGPSLTAALAVHGIHTAADIGAVNGTQFRRAGSNSWFTIHGIGPSKAFDIRYWHEQQLAAAGVTAPQSLPAKQTQALDSKFADMKRQQQAAIDALVPELAQLKATVDAKYAALDQEIDLKVDTVRLDYRGQRSAGDTAAADAANQLQILEDTLLDAQRNLARFQSVSFSRYLKA